MSFQDEFLAWETKSAILSFKSLYLPQRPLLQGHVVWQLEAEAGLVGVVVPQVPVVGWGGAEGDVGAEVVAASLALVAPEAGRLGLYRHTVSRLQVGHLRTTPEPREYKEYFLRLPAYLL